MTNGSYNYIYTELVKNENDILGILAYSLYKRQKIEFIQGFKNKTGNEPSDADLTTFHDISNSASQLESYRNQANQLAQNFLDITLNTQAEELDKFYSTKADHEIKNSRPSFWSGVAQSVVGSVAFVFVLGFLVFFAWSLNQGPKQVIEQVFDVKIVDNKVDGQKPAPSDTEKEV
jgi:hypothetical protein